MGLIGMAEAAKRMGVTNNSARRALQNADVHLVAISPRAYAVEETDLQTFLENRGDYKFGRPRKKQEQAGSHDLSTLRIASNPAPGE